MKLSPYPKHYDTERGAGIGEGSVFVVEPEMEDETIEIVLAEEEEDCA